MAYLAETVKVLYSLGDIVEYRCLGEYYIPPDQVKTRYCLFTGTWSSSQPTCEPTPNTTLTAVNKGDPVPTEADNAEQFGTVAIALVSAEICVLLLLDLVTCANTCRVLKRNICGFRRHLQKVAPLRGRKASSGQWASQKKGLGDGTVGPEDELEVKGLDATDMALRRIEYTGYTHYTAAVLFPKENKRKKILVAS